MENKIWKKLPWFGDRYEVSNTGEIKSLFDINNPKILKTSFDKNGYVRVQLNYNGQYHMFLVHRLVALMFVPNPCAFNEINHIDGNKQNNYYENLEWCSHQQNMQHAFKNNLMHFNLGSKNHNAISFNQFDLQGNFIKHWDSIVECVKELNKELNLSDSQLNNMKTNISCCLHNKHKNCYNYIFSFLDKIDVNKYKHNHNEISIIGVHKKDGDILKFNSIKEANNYITREGKKLQSTIICACIKKRGKRNTHGNYIWSYDKSNKH